MICDHLWVRGFQKSDLVTGLVQLFISTFLLMFKRHLLNNSCVLLGNNIKINIGGSLCITHSLKETRGKETGVLASSCCVNKELQKSQQHTTIHVYIHGFEGQLGWLRFSL